MTRRVVVTGMAGLTPLGSEWPMIRHNIQARQSGVIAKPEWDFLDGLQTRLAAEVPSFSIPGHWPVEPLATMGRVSLLAAMATEKALVDAGLHNDPCITGGRTGLAYGSTSGSPPALATYAEQISVHRTLDGVSINDFIQATGPTCAENLARFFGVTGRLLAPCSACTSGSQSIGYAYEAIRYGAQDVMIAGGAEEMHILAATIFDIMYATSTRNDRPTTTPRPFDRERDGLVVGEGAATLILESLEHAEQRGARIYAEIAGFGSNCDGAHVVNPSAEGMQAVMALALRDAQIEPDLISYVNAHGTATEVGDIAESIATASIFKRLVPISSLKSYLGHTLGACGAIEAWLTIMMLREQWMPPTINLEDVDPRCAALDFVTEVRECAGPWLMTNNFAFGGVNTSLIMRTWS